MPETELHEAAIFGRVADVERLIAARADLEAKNSVRAARRPPTAALRVAAAPLRPPPSSPPPCGAARGGRGAR